MLGIFDVAHSPPSPNSVFRGKHCARTASVATTLANAPSRIQTWQPTERRLIDTADTNPLACVSPPRVPALLRASVFALTEQHRPPEKTHNLKTIRELIEEERLCNPTVTDNMPVDKVLARPVKMASHLPREELVRLALNGVLTPTVAPLERAGAGAGETSTPRSRSGGFGVGLDENLCFLTPQRGTDGINTETACTTSNLNGFLTPQRGGDSIIAETACTSNNMKGGLTPQRGINTVRTCNTIRDWSPQRCGSSTNIATNFNASGELKVYASERECVTPPRSGGSSNTCTAAPKLKREGPRRGRSNTIASTSNHGYRTPPKTPSRALQRARTPFMLEADADNTMEADADYSYQTPQRLSRAPLARLPKKSTSTQNILAFSVECLGALFSQAFESFSTPKRSNAANMVGVDEQELHTPTRDLKSLLEPQRDERTPTQPMQTEGVKGVFFQRSFFKGVHRIAVLKKTTPEGL